MVDTILGKIQSAEENAQVLFNFTHKEVYPEKTSNIFCSNAGTGTGMWM